jgi:hypothetical protein
VLIDVGARLGVQTLKRGVDLLNVPHIRSSERLSCQPGLLRLISHSNKLGLEGSPARRVVMPHTRHKNGKKRRQEQQSHVSNTEAEPMKQTSMQRDDTGKPTEPQAARDDSEQAVQTECSDYKAVAQDIARLIQKHPIPAIAIGVGLGLVFARLLRS